MDNKDFNKYDLTKDEYNKCLTMAEINIFMQGSQVTNKKPKSIFVIAQAGAGKTGLKNFIINEEQDNGELETFIEFNPDDIAIYHTYYQEILKEFPDESYKILQKFVKPALDTYLRQRAVELRNNIIQEGTFGNSDAYIDILEFQRHGGRANIGPIKEDGTREEKVVEGNYDIEINVLAVDRFESYLSSLEREQYFRESNLPPRVVTLKNHDYAYNKMIETMRMVEERKMFDRCRVFKRGYSTNRPELVHISGDGKYATVVEAVETERNKNRHELLSEPEKYYARLETLKKRIEQKGVEEQITRLEELKELFTLEVQKYNNREKGE